MAGGRGEGAPGTDGSCLGSPSRGRWAARLEVFRLKYFNPDLTCSQRDLVPVLHPTGEAAPPTKARSRGPGSFPRGSGDSRGAGSRCPRSAPRLLADPPAGVSARVRGAGTGAARRSRALREAAGPCPWPRGPAGRCRPFVRTGGAPGASLSGCPESGDRYSGAAAAGPGRAVPGVWCGGPALRPGARLRPKIAPGETNPGGARGAQGPRRPAEAPGTCC